MAKIAKTAQKKGGKGRVTLCTCTKPAFPVDYRPAHGRAVKAWGCDCGRVWAYTGALLVESWGGRP